MKLPKLTTAVIAVLLLSPLDSPALGGSGGVDLSFDPGSGVNNIVRHIAVQPDGKILIVGSFSTVRGLRRSGIARLNPDGSGDPTFEAKIDAWVGAIALQPDGKLLVAAAEGMVRLNPDGSLDPEFNVQLDPILLFGLPTLNVQGTAVQPDGKVLIAGVFSTQNGASTNYCIARLNSDGSLDPTFNGSAGGPVDSGVNFPFEGVSKIAVGSGGKVMIGGWFSTVNGVARQNVARLHADGRLDTGFHPAGAIDGFVYSIVMQPDGKALLAGSFTTANRANRSIARLNSNGSMDTSFNSGLDLYESVRAIAVQTDGKVLVAGSVNIYAWAGERLARLNADGSRDGSFQPDVANLGGDVYAIAMQEDGKVLVAGFLKSASRSRAVGTARLLDDGRWDPGFVSGTGLYGINNPSVQAVAVQADGKVLVAGYNVRVDGTRFDAVTRLNVDGSVDVGFAPAVGDYGAVSSLALQMDGKMILGGEFVDVEGTERATLVRLRPDGGLDLGFHPGFSGMNLPDDCPPDAEQWGYFCFESFVATAVAVQADAKVLVAGVRISTICDSSGRCSDVFRHFVARLHPDGSIDHGFNPVSVSSPASVDSLAVQPDGKVLVGGRFGAIGGTVRKGIARLDADGTLDDSFNPGNGTGTNGVVLAVALQIDGKIVIGGDFSRYDGRPRRGIARLNPDGSLDPSFDPGTGVDGSVSAIVSQPGGMVIIGGSFAGVGGVPRSHIARLNADGSVDHGFDPGTGTDAPVWAIAQQADDQILIGGDFTTVDGVVRPRIARLHGRSSLLPPLTIVHADGIVTIAWRATGTDVRLQESSDLVEWSDVAEPVAALDGWLLVRAPIVGVRKFFRLDSP